MQFECPLCFEPHDALSSVAGSSTACQCCGAPFVVPQLADTPLSVPVVPQAPPLVVTYSPEKHGGGARPDADDDRDETDDDRHRRTLRLRRLRQAKESRAKWALLIKFALVVALGVATVIAVSAARGRLAAVERHNEMQKIQPRR